MSLNERQRRFVREYLVDLNATQAAVRAGYSQKTAGSQAFDLLKKPEIQEAIGAAQKEREARLDITVDRIEQELAKMGFANMLDFVTVQDDGLAYVDLKAITREQAAAIQEVTVDEYTEGRGEDARDVKRVRVKLADKRGALELLGKRHRMFVDRQEHSGPAGGPMVSRIELVAMKPADDDSAD